MIRSHKRLKETSHMCSYSTQKHIEQRKLYSERYYNANICRWHTLYVYTLEHDVIFVMGKIFQIAYFLYRPRALLFVISFYRCARGVFFKFWSFVIPAVVCWISEYMNYAFERTLCRESIYQYGSFIFCVLSVLWT